MRPWSSCCTAGSGSSGTTGRTVEAWPVELATLGRDRRAARVPHGWVAVAGGRPRSTTSAWAFARSSSTTRGPRRRIVVGHSAGGHLALWAAATEPTPVVDAVVGLAPIADLTVDGPRRSVTATTRCTTCWGALPTATPIATTWPTRARCPAPRADVRLLHGVVRRPGADRAEPGLRRASPRSSSYRAAVRPFRADRPAERGLSRRARRRQGGGGRGADAAPRDPAPGDRRLPAWTEYPLRALGVSRRSPRLCA